MKIRNIAIILAIALLALIAAPHDAHAAFELGDKTLDRTVGLRAQKFTQSSTGLTTIQDVFEPQQVNGHFTWTLYIHNTGAAALTDLNVVTYYENDNWIFANNNLVDSDPSNANWNAGCVNTLPAGSVCQLGVTASASFGWMKVTAAAGSATNITVVLFTSRI